MHWNNFGMTEPILQDFGGDEVLCDLLPHNYSYKVMTCGLKDDKICFALVFSFFGEGWNTNIGQFY